MAYSGNDFVSVIRSYTPEEDHLTFSVKERVKTVRNDKCSVSEPILPPHGNSYHKSVRFIFKTIVEYVNLHHAEHCEELTKRVLQSNFNGSNTFRTMKISSRQG